MGDLSKHFSISELGCRCGCGICYVDPVLLKALDLLRDMVNGAIDVTSGCRCPTHNRAEGGKAASAHVTTAEEMCQAADITAHDPANRFILLKLAFTIFKRVGIIGNNVIHVDVDESKPQPTYWTWAVKEEA